ncbi:MAG: uroporphyrinogen-III C-methyltransferase [Gammaproteobacteria bacterium]|nr:uroporphyrinogen-III C-methyltransferase [Gammaproteobacteria bacterium]MDH3416055.1 uroporphyrinogen-III C-methyltransferase [Gammaproteobacteria bacterium]
MSKKDTDTDSALPDEEEIIVEESAVEPDPEPDSERGPEPDPDPVESPRKAKGAAIAWLALLLSLLAAAGVGYMAVQDWRAQRSADASSESLLELRNRIASSNDSLAALDEGIAALAQTDAQTAAELEAIRQDMEARLQLFDSLPSRLTNLENSMSSLQGVSAGARNTWLLAEAEYYMQIANAQLQLAGNPHLATLALGMADERIVQLSDPALTEVRQAIADELAALEVMDKPDIQGITLTLSSLARVVDSLPLRQIAEADEDAEVDPDLSGVDRAWASIKGAVSGLVKVTGPDQTAIPLLMPDAVYFLRTNLTLQLQAARLALLRGEQAVFQQSLDDAAAWLEQYFDAESAQVGSALETIDEIRGGMHAVTTPDISQSMRLLRQYKTLVEPAQ